MTGLGFSHGYQGILPACPDNTVYCAAYIAGAAASARSFLTAVNAIDFQAL